MFTDVKQPTLLVIDLLLMRSNSSAPFTGGSCRMSPTNRTFTLQTTRLDVASPATYVIVDGCPSVCDRNYLYARTDVTNTVTALHVACGRVSHMLWQAQTEKRSPSTLPWSLPKVTRVQPHLLTHLPIPWGRPLPVGVRPTGTSVAATNKTAVCAY